MRSMKKKRLFWIVCFWVAVFFAGFALRFGASPVWVALVTLSILGCFFRLDKLYFYCREKERNLGLVNVIIGISFFCVLDWILPSSSALKLPLSVAPLLLFIFGVMFLLASLRSSRL